MLYALLEIPLHSCASLALYMNDVRTTIHAAVPALHDVHGGAESPRHKAATEPLPTEFFGIGLGEGIGDGRAELES